MNSRLLGVVCVCAFMNSGTAYAASFTGLGVRSVSKVSPDGSFVFNDTGRWTATGGWESWDSYSGGTLTGSVSAVSYDGSVVAGSLNGSAYRWTASSGMVGLGSLPASYSYSVSGISSDGSVIAGTGKGTTDPDITQAYKWTAPTGIVGLNTSAIPPSNPETSATGISPDGTAVLGISPIGNTSGYWAADGSWVDLFGSVFERPTFASTDASVIGGDAQHRDIFRWTASEGFQYLNIESMESFANGISADGSILVGSVFSTANDGEWIWDEVNGTRSIRSMLVAEGLDLSGWSLYSARSISADGSIITGSGLNPSGQTEAWIADFSVVPIPPAVWLFGSGLLGLVGMARRKRSV